jgi:hypothetical protein
MTKKGNAAKAGQSTSTNELTPGAASAKGQKKTPIKPTYFNSQRAKRQEPLRQPTSEGIPMATELFELLLNKAATVADAPVEALIAQPNVTSWHSVSGGVGRLSDHVHELAKWLRLTRSDFFITGSALKVIAGGRNKVVKAYSLKRGVTIATCLQFGLFPEGDQQ